METKKSKEVEESLGIIWHFHEQGIKERKQICEELERGVKEKICEELLSQGLIRLEKENIELTSEGEKIALDITRRHRLAERLLNDVLEVKKGEIDKSACEFEHVLSGEVVDRICTLLGHPKFCPHGSSIPPGECCCKADEKIEPIVTSLDRLSLGEDGRIAYITTTEHQQLHKLLSLGIIPGKMLHLHQTSPAFVIKIEETQIALEKELAEHIYVKKV